MCGIAGIAHFDERLVEPTDLHRMNTTMAYQENSSLIQDFVTNARRMNDVSLKSGLPPILAAVLNQYPNNPRSVMIGKLAQKLLKEAGMEVIEHSSYFKGREHDQFYVSKWEGHPNAECHQIFAHMFYDALMRLHSDVFSQFAVRPEDSL